MFLLFRDARSGKKNKNKNKKNNKNNKKKNKKNKKNKKKKWGMFAGVWPILCDRGCACLLFCCRDVLSCLGRG